MEINNHSIFFFFPVNLFQDKSLFGVNQMGSVIPELAVEAERTGRDGAGGAEI